jgi:hypothetical protein
MPKYYKIIPIKHLLKNNVIAKSGDVVDGKAFVNLQNSLDEGFCKETKEKPKGKDAKADKAAQKNIDDAKAAQKNIDDAKAAQKNIDDAKAAQKNIDDAKGGSDDDAGTDLSKMSEDEIVEFAKENEFKLSKKVVKAGKDAMIASIVEQSGE